MLRIRTLEKLAKPLLKVSAVRSVANIGVSHFSSATNLSSPLTIGNWQTSSSGARAFNRLSVRSLSTSSSLVVEPLESLGDSITTAVLLTWSKEIGDSVKEDDVIAIVETDKVTMDIRAKRSGVFMGSLVDAGAEVSVGSPLYKINTSTTEMPAHSESTGDKAKPTPAPVESAPKVLPVMVPVPVMGESITQGVLASWFVKSGADVKADEVVGSIETDKVTVEVRSPFAGRIIETFSQEGDEINVGEPLFVIEPSSGADAEPAAVVATPVAQKAAPKAAPAHAAPAAVPAPVAAPKAAAPKPAVAVAAPAPAPVLGGRGETRVKMTRMRLRIAQRLKEAQNTAAMLTTFQEVDMSNLIALRNKHKDEFEKSHGVKLGFMSAFVRASTAALMEFPAVNGVIDDATNEIVYRNYVDISVAVASPAGLVVPVLRNTENMNFAGVEKAIAHYGKKAKDGALALEDMTGGTFTISNGGVFGSLFGTPIINIPQSAILGMHATKMRAVVVDGQVVARPMMYLALTYDHRLVDGREAVTFLKSIQAKIEDPSRLLLNL